MKTLTLALVSSAALALAACGGAADDTAADGATTADTTTTAAGDAATTGGNVVEVAQGNTDFSTLVAAVTAANLGETLSGTGPFTVFAPTNGAFDKLPEGTVEDLTTNNTEKLGGILKYHVVPGDVSAATLTQAITDAGDAGYTITTVAGGTLTATMEDGNVILTDAAGNRATVVQTDVAASNGVIHAIDTVLMPE